MKKLLSNFKSLPSTIAGGVVAGVGIAVNFIDPNQPAGQVIQLLAANHPKVAAGVGILIGLGMIFGVGPKQQ